MTDLTPDRQAIYLELRKILQEELQVPEEMLALDFDLFHQVDEVDSLDMVVLAEFVRERLGVVIADNAARGVRTMRDYVLLVAQTKATHR